jgi:hypothetical protein
LTAAGQGPPTIIRAFKYSWCERQIQPGPGRKADSSVQFSSPCIKVRHIAPSSSLPADADTVENDTDEQRQQQHAASNDKAHVHSPLWNDVACRLTPALSDCADWALMLLPSRTIPASNANSSMPAAIIKLMFSSPAFRCHLVESDPRNRLIIH